MGNNTPAAYETLWFLDHCTSEQYPPSPTMEYIAENLTNRPVLLTNERFETARYYSEYGQIRQAISLRRLAELIREDLEAERAAMELIGLDDSS